MTTTPIRICLLAAILSVSGTQASVFAQTRVSFAQSLQAASANQQPAPAETEVRRLTVEEAVRLGIENNLGIRIARFDPQIQDLSVAEARAGWAPTFSTSMQSNSTVRPTSGFLSGASGNSVTNDQLISSAGVQQVLPWGGNYSVSWDGTRTTTDSIFTDFSPQLNSTMSLSYTQPLLRGLNIDNIRQQLQLTLKNREIADVDLRATLATTTRTIRNAYWNLAYAIASLQVQQQSLELAQQSLRDTRARVEIGTTPPIDVVGAESEVALREEAVIVAQAQIESFEDTLRTLVFDPTMPDFWTIRIETAELPAFQPTPVNLDAAVANAFERRTDLERAQKRLESTDISIRFLRNQALPDVSATVDYGLTGLGGRQLEPLRGFTGPIGPRSVIAQRGFGSVLNDLFANEFPNWTASLNISYPIGRSPQEANLARVRLERTRAQTDIRNQQLQVATQVRQAARQVLTNQQRVQSNGAARSLAERRLEAEQKKFTAGTSTSFLVFQAQRDLAVARNNELRAILDYNQSVVDLETVQEVPLTTVIAQ